MNTAMKEVVKVENAGRAFGLFLMENEVKFAYDFGVFYILDTRDAGKFRGFCERLGVADGLKITETEYEY